MARSRPPPTHPLKSPTGYARREFQRGEEIDLGIANDDAYHLTEIVGGVCGADVPPAIIQLRLWLRRDESGTWLDLGDLWTLRVGEIGPEICVNLRDLRAVLSERADPASPFGLRQDKSKIQYPTSSIKKEPPESGGV